MKKSWIYTPLVFIANAIAKFLHNLLFNIYRNNWVRSKVSQYPRLKLFLRLIVLQLFNFLDRLVINQSYNYYFSAQHQDIFVFLQKILNQKKEIYPSSSRDTSLKAKKLLAFVSPLPPEKTGIAVYCAELLIFLINYYDIELITDQDYIKLPSPLSHLKQRSSSWFKEKINYYDRVIYHFGNNEFHIHMFDLLRKHPGVVVLHDFFLSGMIAYGEILRKTPASWIYSLYHSHGYLALQKRFIAKKMEEIIETYPCNLEILQRALGVITHSEHALELAKQWYNKDLNKNWKIIPHLRIPEKFCRNTARKALGMDKDAFLVCSFGFIGEYKLNSILLDAWLSSKLHLDPHCELVFVGHAPGNYGAQLIRRIQENNDQNKIHITGWSNKETYEQYLQAADVAVQLRTMSRGETSGTALDCMNYELATIVNAHGSMAEFPEDAVWMLPDKFTRSELVNALESLWQDTERRKKIAKRGKELIVKKHNPEICANQYVEAIESSYQSNYFSYLKDIEIDLKNLPSHSSLKETAQNIAINYPVNPSQQQLLIDVSNFIEKDLNKKIKDTLNYHLFEIIRNSPVNVRVEPIYITKKNGTVEYNYARKFTSKLLGIPTFYLQDSAIELRSGDMYYVSDMPNLDLFQAVKSGLFSHWRNNNVKINILMPDLLPIQKTGFFSNDITEEYKNWLKTVSQLADRMILSSSFHVDELSHWLIRQGAEDCFSLESLEMSSIPVGTDLHIDTLSNLEANIVRLISALTLLRNSLQPSETNEKENHENR